MTSQNLMLHRAVERGTKSSLVGILVNLGLALTKCTAGLVGHSFALVADGLESGADVLSGLVVLFALKLAIKPPDADHPYEHGKAEPFAAIVVGLSLTETLTANRWQWTPLRTLLCRRHKQQ